MAKRKTPAPGEVGVVYVYPGAYGFRYTCRGLDGKVLYDSPYPFRSRRSAQKEIQQRWPGVKVSFETI